MSNYNIGLSGLKSNSEAIDTISNNIANSNTVGYKAAEFVFQDQYYKAINPLDPARAGMGVAKQNIRRIFTQGAVQSSANTLDMAITGSMGLFRLASNTNSDEIYYTRNGQFAVSVQTDPSSPYPETRNYIVNENGHFLTGYLGNGTEVTDTLGALTMPPPVKNPEGTTESQVYVNLNSQRTPFLSSDPDFDKSNVNTYHFKTSQTVYSRLTEAGEPHTFTLYYRRIDDDSKTLTFTQASGFFSMDQTSVADPADTATNIELGSSVSRTFTRLTPDGAATHSYQLTLEDGTIVTMTSSDEWDDYADLLNNGDATETFDVTLSQYEVYAQLDDVMYNNPSSAIDSLTDLVAGEDYGDNTYLNVPLTGGTGTGATATITVVDGAVTAVTLVNAGNGYTVGDPLSATRANLGGGTGDIFEIDVGTLIGVSAFSDTTGVSLTEDISTGDVAPIAVMQFWAGKNIDAIALDPDTFEPTFRTAVGLTAWVESEGGESDLFTFDVDLTNTNNFASPFSVYESSQDGYSTSYLNSVVVGSDGKIVGTYGDGRQYIAGQLVLVHFSATNGLVPVGNNEYVASYASGEEVDDGVVRDVPGVRGLGGIRAGAVEASNVDLASELVKLLIQQRMYSANSQSIRAFDETLQTTIRMTGG